MKPPDDFWVPVGISLVILSICAGMGFLIWVAK
jgi:membrane protein implicated in regulation of membrane protease activity